MAEVKIVQNVLKHNDEIAAMNRDTLRGAGVYCVDLIGGARLETDPQRVRAYRPHS